MCRVLPPEMNAIEYDFSAEFIPMSKSTRIASVKFTATEGKFPANKLPDLKESGLMLGNRFEKGLFNISSHTARILRHLICAPGSKPYSGSDFSYSAACRYWHAAPIGHEVVINGKRLVADSQEERIHNQHDRVPLDSVGVSKQLHQLHEALYPCTAADKHNMPITPGVNGVKWLICFQKVCEIQLSTSGNPILGGSE